MPPIGYAAAVQGSHSSVLRFVPCVALRGQYEYLSPLRIALVFLAAMDAHGKPNTDPTPGAASSGGE